MTTRAESHGWVPWTPETEEPELAAAVIAFEPLETNAGKQCARWLRESSLLQWPQSVTWVYHRHGVIEGFFAMRSGNVEIDLPRSKVWEKAETINRPCSIVEWLCRHRGDQYEGGVVINQAMKVGEIQGNIALVIEPFDTTIAKILRKEHDYLRPTANGHLWIPLYDMDDQLMPRSSAA